jgi:hypothetical protein
LFEARQEGSCPISVEGVRVTVTPSLGCAHFHNDDPRGEVWTGQWPGEDDCTRLGFYVNGDPDFPDLNRLFTDCVWDADAQRWERKQ